MARVPSHSPHREISPGSTPVPSFTGRQQRTSINRYMMLSIYIATCAVKVFTLTRWNRTHMAGHILQSPCLMQTTLYTSLPHAATPRPCADTEKPERQPVLQGHSKQSLPTACARRQCPHTVEIHLRPYSYKQHGHYTHMHHVAIPWRDVDRMCHQQAYGTMTPKDGYILILIVTILKD